MRVWLDPQRMAAHGLTVAGRRARRSARENAEIPGGPRRGHGARVLGAHPRRAGDAGGVRRDHRRASRATTWSACGDVAEVEVGAEDERTVARYNGAAGGRARHRQAVEGEHRRRRRARCARRCPELRDAAARRDEARRRLRLLDLHRGLDPRGRRTPLVIAIVPGGPRDPRLPEEPARHAHPDGGDPDLDHRRLRRRLLPRLHHQHPDAARAGAGDRAGRGRRHRRARERLPAHGDGQEPRCAPRSTARRRSASPILATTIALVAVFVPVAFLTGTVGRLFNEFGISVAVAVLISGFVALTLTPDALLADARGRSTAASDELGDPLRSTRFFDWLEPRLRAHAALRPAPARLVVIGARSSLVAASVVLFRLLPRELVPTEDRGIGLRHRDRARGLDARLHRPLHAAGRGDAPARCRSVAGLFTAIGLGFGGPGRVTNGFIFLRLKPHGRARALAAGDRPGALPAAARRSPACSPS